MTPTTGQITTPSSTTTRPTQPRALKSRVFAGQDIDFYFDKYFEFFHPYLPIVRIREPDAIYNSGPVLFWVILVTACRKSSHDGGVFDFLVDAVKSEVWEAVSDPPMSLATINALLILSAWPLPTIRFMKDPSPIYVSMLMNSCYLLGIHTGRGDFPASTYPAYRLSVSNEEAVYTWVGYNIVSQRISTYSGTPATGQFFNSTIESILDRTSPVQVPLYFCVLLETAAFLHRLSRSMAATLEEGRGISHHVVDHFVEDFAKVQRLLSAENVSGDTSPPYKPTYGLLTRCSERCGPPHDSIHPPRDPNLLFHARPRLQPGDFQALRTPLLDHGTSCCESRHQATKRHCLPLPRTTFRMPLNAHRRLRYHLNPHFSIAQGLCRRPYPRGRGHAG